VIRPTAGPRDPDLSARVSANLPRLRLQAGLSASELARLAGLDQRTVSGAERGETTPTFATLRCIAKALGVHVGMLVE
jgi:transcriptional regulator with XRE-family HTH domain